MSLLAHVESRVESSGGRDSELVMVDQGPSKGPDRVLSKRLDEEIREKKRRVADLETEIKRLRRQISDYEEGRSIMY